MPRHGVGQRHATAAAALRSALRAVAALDAPPHGCGGESSVRRRPGAQRRGGRRPPGHAAPPQAAEQLPAAVQGRHRGDRRRAALHPGRRGGHTDAVRADREQTERDRQRGHRQRAVAWFEAGLFRERAATAETASDAALKAAIGPPRGPGTCPRRVEHLHAALARAAPSRPVTSKPSAPTRTLNGCGPSSRSPCRAGFGRPVERERCGFSDESRPRWLTFLR